jgi:hypothetical protein
MTGIKPKAAADVPTTSAIGALEAIEKLHAVSTRRERLGQAAAPMSSTHELPVGLWLSITLTYQSTRCGRESSGEVIG